MLGYNWYDKEIRNTNLLKTIQLWLSYTLQNLHDILDLWPAKHSLKPSEKHRFLNAAATSFAVETSFASFKWHSHQLHLGWVYETSSNAFLWVGKLVFKTLYKLTLSHCKLALKLQVEVDLWEGQKTKTLWGRAPVQVTSGRSLMSVHVMVHRWLWQRTNHTSRKKYI